MFVLISLEATGSQFSIAVVVVFFSLVYCHRYVRDIPRQPKRAGQDKPLTGRLLSGWGLVVVATVHLMFLPSVLPHVLPGHMMSDTVSILGSIDFVMGECDR